MTLAAARPLGLADGVLRLGLDSEALRRELAARGNARPARRARQRGRGRVRSRSRSVRCRRERVDETPLAQARQRQQETLADPLVQAAVEIFGAEVRGVRERRSATEDGA